MIDLDVTAFDSEGQEIEIPRCPQCNSYMSQVVGPTHHTWVCLCQINYKTVYKLDQNLISDMKNRPEKHIEDSWTVNLKQSKP